MVSRPPCLGSPPKIRLAFVAWLIALLLGIAPAAALADSGPSPDPTPTSPQPDPGGSTSPSPDPAPVKEPAPDTSTPVSKPQPKSVPSPVSRTPASRPAPITRKTPTRQRRAPVHVPSAPVVVHPKVIHSRAARPKPVQHARPKPKATPADPVRLPAPAPVSFTPVDHPKRLHDLNVSLLAAGCMLLLLLALASVALSRMAFSLNATSRERY